MCTCSVRVVAVPVVAGLDADVVQQSYAPDILVLGWVRSNELTEDS